ncbi:adenine phosphoribosyltransferase [Patescibacteria group bacterium]|nr:adenine phosphoribosyltransferase [Patescibacteria group bacterium]MCG2694958.1 adenine phosphoribosyltransferase [Candidatus Parcubacteria bacterium]
MKTYRKIFPKKNVLLVVIHVQNYEQTLKNIKIAVEEGVDGVFFISHGEVNHAYLSALLVLVKAQYFNLWTGLNFLDLSVKDAFIELPLSAKGLWVDNSGIDDFVDSGGIFPQHILELRKRVKKDWRGLYFGGVAFKYQKQSTDLVKVSKTATRFLDVITTSGDRTGKPPSLVKITTMRNSIGDFPLAIASGMTPENVGDYRDLADCFLVSTGISKDFLNLDQKKVAKFVKAIS